MTKRHDPLVLNVLPTGIWMGEDDIALLVRGTGVEVGKPVVSRSLGRLVKDRAVVKTTNWRGVQFRRAGGPS